MRRQTIKNMPPLLSKALSVTMTLFKRCNSLIRGRANKGNSLSSTPANKPLTYVFCRLFRFCKSHPPTISQKDKASYIEQNCPPALGDGLPQRLSDIVINNYNSRFPISSATDWQETWYDREYIRGRFENDKSFIKTLTSICSDHFANPEYSVELMSLDMGISSSMLYKTLMRLRHISPSKYIEEQRVLLAINLLRKSPDLTDIHLADRSGFKTVTSLRRCVTNLTGKSVEQFRSDEIRNRKLRLQ